MKNIARIISVSSAAVLGMASLLSQNTATPSDAWALTDGLGRKARDYSVAGPKKDKFVGMFY